MFGYSLCYFIIIPNQASCLFLRWNSITKVSFILRIVTNIGWLSSCRFIRIKTIIFFILFEPFLFKIVKVYSCLAFRLLFLHFHWLVRTIKIYSFSKHFIISFWALFTLLFLFLLFSYCHCSSFSLQLFHLLLKFRWRLYWWIILFIYFYFFLDRLIHLFEFFKFKWWVLSFRKV